MSFYEDTVLRAELRAVTRDLAKLREDSVSCIEKLQAELQQEKASSAKAAKSAILKFRSSVNRRYYPGYHEDMCKAVEKAILEGGK